MAGRTIKEDGRSWPGVGDTTKGREPSAYNQRHFPGTDSASAWEKDYVFNIQAQNFVADGPDSVGRSKGIRSLDVFVI